MSAWQAAVTVAVVALGTWLTRALPFWLFPKGQKTPPFIRYLGRVLPQAVMGMLVVYCLREVDIFSAPHGLPELLAALAAVGLQLLKRNVALSIFGATALYMALLALI